MNFRNFFWAAFAASLITTAVWTSEAMARDCLDGTVEASWDDFFSTKYAGRLAIATDATTPEEAKDAYTYCVLDTDFFKPTAKIRKRYDRIYFVFNNRPAVTPANAEVSFLGLQVRSKSETGAGSVTMRREGDNWVERPLDRKYLERQFSKTAEGMTMVARAHSKTMFASRGLTMANSEPSPFSDEATFASKVDASVHGEITPRDGVQNRRTWDYRDRMSFVGSLLNDGEPSAVTAIWVSFAQRSSGGFLKPPKRVVTGVRVGNSAEIDVELFGSNPEIPEYRYKVQFTR